MTEQQIETHDSPARHKTSPWWVIVLAAAGGLLALCLFACIGVELYPRLSEWLFGNRLVNVPAPDFTLTTLDGRKVTLSQLRDKPVAINFWATWCPSCVQELPDIQTFYRQHKGRVHLLTISVDSNKQTVAAFAKEKGLAVPILFDEGGAVSALYHVRGIPVTVFVNRDGVLVSRHIGSRTQAQLATYLQEALATEKAGQKTD